MRAIRKLPESQENAARELELQIGLGAAMHVSRGWGSPDVRPVWERVHELARAIDSRPNLARPDIAKTLRRSSQTNVNRALPLVGDGKLIRHVDDLDRHITDKAQ